ncbi:MAG: BspA family leucine-rich repeat surface protein, partial [Oscillibacter sp.]|nr:BspA family leucine-rich repeat surface protein [Oscillibacter sp.]
MKKNVLGIFAALFVFVVLLPMRVYATDTGAADVYAILYNDGTLVFQNGDTADPERTATNTYEVDLNAVYTGYSSSYAPWYNERESVLVVDFKDNVAPASTSYWFENCSQLERIDNIQNLDTSNVTTMRHMFYYCSGLTALDVSSFNTANVTD